MKFMSTNESSIHDSVVLFLGTPEIGGLTVIQGLEIVRGCRGLNIVSADVVEVSVGRV